MLPRMIRSELRDRVAIVTIDNPPVNALPVAGWFDLADALRAAGRNQEVRAVILRAMSLLARSGGIQDEFTFTGGVARNEAGVRALRALVEENYGKRKINISADSIYTGALGAAHFALRAAAA